MQVSCKHGVRTWVEARDKSFSIDENTPSHLGQDLTKGLDTSLFRRLWEASQLVGKAKAVEEIAVVIRRNALVAMSTTYGEVIQRIRTAKKTGILRYGEVASSKARNIL